MCRNSQNAIRTMAINDHWNSWNSHWNSLKSMKFPLKLWRNPKDIQRISKGIQGLKFLEALGHKKGPFWEAMEVNFGSRTSLCGLATVPWSGRSRHAGIGFRSEIDVDSMSCPYHRALHCRFETCDKDKAFEVSGKVSTFEDTKIVQTCTCGVGQCWNLRNLNNQGLLKMFHSAKMFWMCLYSWGKSFHSWQAFVQVERCKRVAPLQDHFSKF